MPHPSEAVQHGLFATLAQLEHRSCVGRTTTLACGAVKITRCVSEQTSVGIASVRRPSGKAVQRGLRAAAIHLEHPAVAERTARLSGAIELAVGVTDHRSPSI